MKPFKIEDLTKENGFSPFAYNFDQPIHVQICTGRTQPCVMYTSNTVHGVSRHYMSYELNSKFLPGVYYVNPQG